jgi:hypothetical protein
MPRKERSVAQGKRVTRREGRKVERENGKRSRPKRVSGRGKRTQSQYVGRTRAKRFW